MKFTSREAVLSWIVGMLVQFFLLVRRAESQDL